MRRVCVSGVIVYRIVPAWQRDVVFIDTEEEERRSVRHTD